MKPEIALDIVYTQVISKSAQRKTLDIQLNYLKSLRDKSVIADINICVRNRA